MRRLMARGRPAKLKEGRTVRGRRPHPVSKVDTIIIKPKSKVWNMKLEARMDILT